MHVGRGEDISVADTLHCISMEKLERFTSIFLRYILESARLGDARATIAIIPRAVILGTYTGERCLATCRKEIVVVVVLR